MDTITVASRSPMAIRIRKPIENLDKPGLEPEHGYIVLHGMSHHDTHNGMGITRGVDPEVFHPWLEEQKAGNTPLAGLVYEISPDELNMPMGASYGFEPGLAALTANEENNEAAASGSTVTHAGPATSTDMAATSDTPADDTPRGDPDPVPMAHTQTPATRLVVPDEAEEVATSHSSPAPDAPPAPAPEPTPPPPVSPAPQPAP